MHRIPKETSKAIARTFLEASCYLVELGAISEAMPLLMRAASMGDTEAQVNLGVAYSYGTGVEADEIKSQFWLRRAANSGSSHGAFNLGLSYLECGNVRRARFWFERAERLGHEDAEAYLVQTKRLARQPR